MQNQRIARELILIAKLLVSDKIKIDKNSLNEFRKEYLRVIRDVDRKMKTWEDAVRIEEGIRRYRDYVEKYLYDIILGSHMKKISQGVKNEDLDYFAKQLQSSAWDFINAINYLATLANDIDRYTFDDRKKTGISRVKRTGRKALKDVKEYIEYSLGEQTIDLANKVTLGPSVIIPIESCTQDDFLGVVEPIKKAQRLVKAAGFGSVLDKSVFKVTPKSKIGLISAEYDPTKDFIKVRLLGQRARTIVHELGHRLWFRFLGGRSKQYWKDAFDGDLIQIQETDVLNILSRMKEMSKRQSETYIPRLIKPSVKEWEKENISDPVVPYKAQYFLDRRFAWGNSEKKEDWDKYRKFWIGDFVGQPVMRNFVTDYGNTNELEAFAEVFMLICLNKKVNGVVLSWFNNVTKSI